MSGASQRQAARVVAITYPLTFVIMTVAFSRFYAPLLVCNDRALTAHNISIRPQDFHNYIALALVYGIGLVVLPAALYVILRPIGRGVARFAAFSRLAYAFLWFTTLLDYFCRLAGPLRCELSSCVRAGSSGSASSIAISVGLGCILP